MVVRHGNWKDEEGPVPGTGRLWLASDSYDGSFTTENPGNEAFFFGNCRVIAAAGASSATEAAKKAASGDTDVEGQPRSACRMKHGCHATATVS